MTPENQYKQVALPVYHSLYRHTKPTIDYGFELLGINSCIKLNLIAKCFIYTPIVVIRKFVYKKETV